MGVHRPSLSERSAHRSFQLRRANAGTPVKDASRLKTPIIPQSLTTQLNTGAKVDNFHKMKYILVSGGTQIEVPRLLYIHLTRNVGVVSGVGKGTIGKLLCREPLAKKCIHRAKSL